MSQAFSTKVRCVGKRWRDLFDDGHEGVYQLKNETSTSVAKSTSLNDPDLNLESADKLFDKMNALIFGGAHPKAIAFRSVSAAADAPVPTSVAALPLTLDTPAPPQQNVVPVSETDPDTDEQSWHSHWQSFRSGAPTAAIPKASAKKTAAKPHAKAGTRKRKGGGDQSDMPPPPAPPPKEARKSSIINMNPLDHAEPHSQGSAERQQKRKAANSDTETAGGGVLVLEGQVDLGTQDADSKWQQQFEEKYRTIFNIAIKHENPVDDVEIAFVKNTMAQKVKDASKFLNDVACPFHIIGSFANMLLHDSIFD